MYELEQLGASTYVIRSPANMGVFVVGDSAYLIDSGNDKEAGKKVLRHLEQQGWRLEAVFNTHANADHIGGNKLLRERTGCALYASGVEAAFTQWPVLEPSFLYGGFPPKALRSKFFMAQPSEAQPLTEAILPEGLTAFPLPGHFFDMVGFRTADGVCFLADCLFGMPTLEKYHISFFYDVAAALETLDAVEAMEAALFVPAHSEPTSDIRPLVAANRAKMLEIAALLRELCTEPRGSEELLRLLFDHYGLSLDWSQYVLVGSTLRSYLTFLLERGELEAIFDQNRLLWRRI